MTSYLEFICGLFHGIGLMMLGGGHIWLTTFTIRAEKSPGNYGMLFICESLPRMSVIMEVGILLLFLSGLSRLIIWADPGLLFLPQPYGWVMMAKILLYIFVVINGVYINKCIYIILKNLAPSQQGPNQDFQKAWIRFKILSRLNLLLVMVVVALGETLSFSPTSAFAHHGGLVIESEELEEYQESALWEQEVTADAYRIKFLSYPGEPFINKSTRLVFEVQSVETGLYINDIEVKVKIKDPEGNENYLEAEEVEGVAGYYEAKNIFKKEGEYDLVFKSKINGKDIIASFKKGAVDKMKEGYWYRVMGKAVVLTATIVTLIGAFISLRFRFS